MNKIDIQIWTFLFVENWQFNHKVSPILFPENILCLKKCPGNLRKYEIKETSKIPISKLFREIGKYLKLQIGLYSKNSIFCFFLELRKIEKSNWSKIQKFQNIFVN